MRAFVTNISVQPAPIPYALARTTKIFVDDDIENGKLLARYIRVDISRAVRVSKFTEMSQRLAANQRDLIDVIKAEKNSALAAICERSGGTARMLLMALREQVNRSALATACESASSRLRAP